MIKEEEFIDKKMQLTLKKISKFYENIEVCQKLILKNRISEALPLLKEIIIERQFVNINPFKGVGHIQSWKYFYPKGPLQWFKEAHGWKVVDGNPYDLFNICTMIQLHDNKMKGDEILKEFQNLSESKEETYQLTLGRANIYYQNEQYVEAEKLYLFIEENQPENELIHEYLAWVYYQFDQKDKIAEHTQKCLKINSNNLNALYIETASAKAHNDTIIRSLKRLAEKFPNYYRIYLELGEINDEFQQCMYYYRKALTFEPNSAFILACIGFAYIDHSEDEAKKYVEKALKISSSCGWGYVVLGKLSMKNKMIDEAEKNYVKAIEFSPFNVNFHCFLGDLYSSQNNYAKALCCYQKCTELDPYDSKYHILMGSIYESMNQIDFAEKYYEKAVSVNSEEFKSIKSLAQFYRQKKDYNSAIEMYMRQIQAGPSHPQQICLLLASCYIELENLEKAKFWINKCDKKKIMSYRLYWSVMGKFERMNNNYIECLRWMLKNRNAAMEESIDDEMEEVLEEMKQKEEFFKGLLKGLTSITEKNIENLYSLIILTEICSRFGLEKEKNELVKNIAELKKLIPRHGHSSV